MDDSDLLAAISTTLAGTDGWNGALARILDHFGADSGTIHVIAADGLLHMRAAKNVPAVVLDVVKTIPVGKGMAGLAVLRKQPVSVCDLQTDTSGDVPAGARMTGLQGSIVVPLLRDDDAVGALGIANQGERTFSDAETRLLLDVGKLMAASA